MTEPQKARMFAGVEVLIFVSYASGMPGFSPSEWVSDKLEVLKVHSQPTILITSTASLLESTENLTVIKVPSLSQRDFTTEKSIASNLDVECSLPGKALHSFYVATLGRLFDFLFRLLAGQNSDGRWSWSITSLPVIMYHCLRNSSSRIFATGGPSSAHFSSVLAGIFTRRKVVLEFQDPFIGSEMHLVDRTTKAMRGIERFLISRSDKTIFVTNAAADSAKARNPRLAKKIHAIYPGAWKISQPKRPASQPSEKYTFMHLGTLYSTRNLDSFLEAVVRTSVSKVPRPEEILIHNMGEIALTQIDDYFASGIFIQTHVLPRLQALNLASESDCLLLVQHNDTRSLETIPYKFYDYLNLGLNIFGIVNSEELKGLIKRAGGYACQQGDVESAIGELARLFDDLSLRRSNPKGLEINIVEQFRLALSS